MPRHYNMQVCPYCRGDNVSMYKSGGTQFLFCSDCEEEYEINNYEAGNPYEYEDSYINVKDNFDEEEW